MRVLRQREGGHSMEEIRRPHDSFFRRLIKDIVAIKL